MTARSRARLLRAALLERRVRRSERRTGAILVYHRVAQATGDRTRELSPAVGREQLAAELRHLASRYRVVPPDEVHAAVRSRRPGERLPVAVTFDDDTRSHVDEALPVLRSAGLVAAFFVGGASLRGGPRPWWESLQALLDAGRTPAGVPLPAPLVEAALRREPGAIGRLGLAVESLDPEARRDLERTLAASLPDDGGDPGLDDRALRDLAAGQRIGFHTLWHDPLPSLGDDDLRRSLEDGRAELARRVGRDVDLIAYPHGAADDRVAAAAAAAGYRLGFAGRNRAVSAADGPLLLPRLDPWHDSLGTFALTVARAMLTAPAA